MTALMTPRLIYLQVISGEFIIQGTDDLWCCLNYYHDRSPNMRSTLLTVTNSLLNKFQWHAKDQIPQTVKKKGKVTFEVVHTF